MFDESVPLYKHVDVVVIGGGTAGFAAAIAAAKLNKQVLIIEDHAYLGGTATAGMVCQFLGFNKGETTESQVGILDDLLKRLTAYHATSGVQTIYLSGIKEMGVGAATYNPDALKLILDEMVTAAGVEVLFHTRMITAITEDEKIKSVIIHNLSGIQRVEADVFIDASFHGSLAVAAGCDYKLGDDDGVLQPGTMMYRSDHVDAAEYHDVPRSEKKQLANQGVAAGALNVGNLLSRSLPDGTFYTNMSRVKVDPLDQEAYSQAEITGRKQISLISQYFKQSVPGFENAIVTDTADQLGLRDSRRIVGLYTLTNQDVLTSQTFPDTVASSDYPIDVHDANGLSSVLKKPAGGQFHIPFRCLQTKIANLVLAGRCLSTEYEAHACARVMATCMRLGEAAGIAAADSINIGIPVNQYDGQRIKTFIQ
ncbi:FAD-dependent oxidoreductase [Lacticaseibacillus baoqingensis]|uniref:FAD-dependent oxidoreductase n=1 Tax=Lacticaseibacillus baoqingensis TaxID=2486013 RepID=A0ABW4EA43_9LACO|nr:FAD-dependent oxidoreductase [Lacticaseibacillus baoqingensis]